MFRRRRQTVHHRSVVRPLFFEEGTAIFFQVKRTISQGNHHRLWLYPGYGPATTAKMIENPTKNTSIGKWVIMAEQNFLHKWQTIDCRIENVCLMSKYLNYHALHTHTDITTWQLPFTNCASFHLSQISFAQIFENALANESQSNLIATKMYVHFFIILIIWMQSDVSFAHFFCIK